MIERLAPAIRPGLRAGLGLGLVLLLADRDGLARAEGPGPIPWRVDFVRAMAEARTRAIPLWIQFTGPWCHHCRRMEAETLVHPEVVASARGRTIPVRLSTEQHEALALGFGLSGLPATVILGPDGRLIDKHEGFADAATFRAFLDQNLGPAPETGTETETDQRTIDARTGEATAPDSTDVRADPGLGMAGCCPVTLVQNRRLVAGRPELAVHHEGFAYRFATPEAREAFLMRAAAFVPANAGRCPVGSVDRGTSDPGNPRFGVLFRGRLYLCADAEARHRFLRSPEAYAEADVADGGFCPHCRARAGLLVRGLPEYSASHDGRLYLFPGPDHLEAFRASPETFVR